MALEIKQRHVDELRTNGWVSVSLGLSISRHLI